MYSGHTYLLLSVLCATPQGAKGGQEPFRGCYEKLTGVFDICERRDSGQKPSLITHVRLTLLFTELYRVGCAPEENMIQTADESLEMRRQRLIEQSLELNSSLSEALAVFEIARELVPLPILVNYEPTRYSNSSSRD